MSGHGTLELYGVGITGTKTVGELADDNVLTTAQISALIQEAENTIIDGAPGSYNNLQEIITQLDTDDTNVAATLQSKIELLTADRVAFKALYSDQVSTQTAASVAVLNTISATLATDMAANRLDDVQIASMLSTEKIRSDQTDAAVSQYLAAHETAEEQDDEALATAIDTQLDGQTQVNTAVAGEVSALESSHASDAAAFDAALSTEDARAYEVRSEYTNTLTNGVAEGAAAWDALSTQIGAEATSAEASLASLSTDLQGRVAGFAVEKSAVEEGLQTLSATYVQKRAAFDDSYAQVNTALATRLATNDGDRALADQDIVQHRAIQEAARSTSLAEADAAEVELRAFMADTESFAEEYGMMKASGEQPVVTGALAVDDEANYLKIGTSWYLKADTTGESSQLALFHRDPTTLVVTMVLPFKTTKPIATAPIASASEYVRVAGSALVPGDRLVYRFPTSNSGTKHALTVATVESIHAESGTAKVSWGEAVPRGGEYKSEIGALVEESGFRWFSGAKGDLTDATYTDGADDVVDAGTVQQYLGRFVRKTGIHLDANNVLQESTQHNYFEANAGTHYRYILKKANGRDGFELDGKFFSRVVVAPGGKLYRGAGQTWTTTTRNLAHFQATNADGTKDFVVLNGQSGEWDLVQGVQAAHAYGEWQPASIAPISIGPDPNHVRAITLNNGDVLNIFADESSLIGFGPAFPGVHASYTNNGSGDWVVIGLDLQIHSYLNGSPIAAGAPEFLSGETAAAALLGPVNVGSTRTPLLPSLTAGPGSAKATVKAAFGNSQHYSFAHPYMGQEVVFRKKIGKILSGNDSSLNLAFADHARYPYFVSTDEKIAIFYVTGTRSTSNRYHLIDYAGILGGLTSGNVTLDLGAGTGIDYALNTGAISASAAVELTQLGDWVVSADNDVVGEQGSTAVNTRGWGESFADEVGEEFGYASTTTFSVGSKSESETFALAVVPGGAANRTYEWSMRAEDGETGQVRTMAVFGFNATGAAAAKMHAFAFAGDSAIFNAGTAPAELDHGLELHYIDWDNNTEGAGGRYFRHQEGLGFETNAEGTPVVVAAAAEAYHYEAYNGNMVILRDSSASPANADYRWRVFPMPTAGLSAGAELTNEALANGALPTVFTNSTELLAHGDGSSWTFTPGTVAANIIDQTVFAEGIHKFTNMRFSSTEQRILIDAADAPDGVLGFAGRYLRASSFGGEAEGKIFKITEVTNTQVGLGQRQNRIVYTSNTAQGEFRSHTYKNVLLDPVKEKLQPGETAGPLGLSGIKITEVGSAGTMARMGPAEGQLAFVTVDGLTQDGSQRYYRYMCWFAGDSTSEAGWYTVSFSTYGTVFDPTDATHLVMKSASLIFPASLPGVTSTNPIPKGFNAVAVGTPSSPKPLVLNTIDLYTENGVDYATYAKNGHQFDAVQIRLSAETEVHPSLGLVSSIADVQYNSWRHAGAVEFLITDETRALKTGDIGFSNYTDGQWHHFAAAMDLQSNEPSLKFYADGELKWSENLANASFADLEQVAKGVQIGSGVLSTNPDEESLEHQLLDGQIKNVFIHDTLLGPGDIQARASIAAPEEPKMHKVVQIQML